MVETSVWYEQCFLPSGTVRNSQSCGWSSMVSSALKYWTWYRTLLSSSHENHTTASKASPPNHKKNTSLSIISTRSELVVTVSHLLKGIVDTGHLRGFGYSYADSFGLNAKVRTMNKHIAILLLAYSTPSSVDK